jgi:hypothetical protein
MAQLRRLRLNLDLPWCSSLLSLYLLIYINRLVRLASSTATIRKSSD